MPILISGSQKAREIEFKDQFEPYRAALQDATFNYAAKNPGTWSNTLKVCTIDDFADQRIGISTNSLALTGATVGFAVTANIDGAIIPGIGTTGGFTGFLKGIITGVSTDSTNSNSTIDVKITDRMSVIGGITSYFPIDYAEGNSITAYTTSRERKSTEKRKTLNTKTH